MKPEGLSVVLTGAAGSIGSALAAVLARAGARVLLVGRRGAPLAALAESLGAGVRTLRVQALAADITTAAGRATIRDIAAARGCNALINCAALPGFGRFADADDGEIDAVLRTNLVAPIQLTLALLPQLQAQRQARVLNIGSATGRLGVPAAACVAFEDSGNGVRAAKAAGLFTVVTPTIWTATQDFHGAAPHPIVASAGPAGRARSTGRSTTGSAAPSSGSASTPGTSSTSTSGSIRPSSPARRSHSGRAWRCRSTLPTLTT